MTEKPNTICTERRILKWQPGHAPHWAKQAAANRFQFSNAVIGRSPAMSLPSSTDAVRLLTVQSLLLPLSLPLQGFILVQSDRKVFRDKLPDEP
jgi:hypothetical protein